MPKTDKEKALLFRREVDSQFKPSFIRSRHRLESVFGVVEVIQEVLVASLRHDGVVCGNKCAAAEMLLDNLQGRQSHGSPD